MRTKVFFLFSFFLFLVLSCSNPLADQQLSMKIDPGVTETWLSLHVNNLNRDAHYIVERNGKTLFNSRIQKNEIVLYDKELEPATDYTYRFYALQNGATSSEIQTTISTMDTTSNNINMSSFEFGVGLASSEFYDVAIIDENNIWAVGEIYTADNHYNAAHWDGQKWELRKIPSIICGNNSPIQSAIFTVFAFSSNDVWFSDGAELIYFNGSTFKQDCSINPLLTGKINKIWGTSSSDLYVVGNGGMIAHYDGTSWTKIESPAGTGGTDLDIKDIWGVKGDGNSPFILAVTLADNSTYKPKVLQIENKRVTSVFVDISRYLLGVWFDSPNKYYLCGAGIFYKSKTEINWHETLPYGIHLIPTYKVRGSGENNIWLAGQLGLLIHFNGKTWKISEPLDSAIDYQGIDVKDNLAVAVGFKNSKAIITRIKLNP